MAYSSLGSGPTVISHNVRGLNIPEKRSALLRELKKGRPHFTFLQETHFETNKIPRLTDSYFTEAYHATNDLAKSKGTSILISREASFELTDRLTDPGGRYLFLKGRYRGSTITLANVYFPNSSHLTFCKKIVGELEAFSSGCIILGGGLQLAIKPANRHIHREVVHQISNPEKSQSFTEFPTPYRLLEILTPRYQRLHLLLCAPCQILQIGLSICVT